MSCASLKKRPWGVPSKLLFTRDTSKFKGQTNVTSNSIFKPVTIYASDPRRSIHDFPVSCDGDAAFLAWLDADPTSDEPATTVENVQARTYQWSQLEIQVVLAKYEQLAQNKNATVRWFRQHLAQSQLAERLQPSHIQYWLRAKENAAIGNKRGRKVALDAAGEIYNDCVAACRAQLAAGLPGDAHILASIIRAVIECSGHPELLKHFLVSETWTYAFLHANDLKPRKGTNNRKEPANWEAQLEKHVLRVAHVVKTKNIPKALVVAFDHVGFQVLPIKNTTWAPRGSDVVPLIGLDDKRQITAVVAEALDDDGSGIVVGIQLIYTGTTERCLPAVEHRQLETFADFHFTYTYNHWADEDTNYELFENIIVKHFLNTKTRLRLPPDHPSMVILDCWPVQKSEHFRARVAASWPWIHLEYVPPGCTGKGQKFDVDGGGVYKPKLQERTTRYVQEEFTKALKGGESLENVKLDLTLGTMKTRQLYWIQEVHSEFKSNVLARTKGWNLTGIPRAFTAACQEEEAVKVHAEGELWPTGNTLQLVPVGDEMVPEASTDDAEWILNPNSEVDVNSGASTSTVPSCRGSYEEHGAEIDDARKGKKARTDVEEHFEFSDMNADTYALTLAAGKDEFSFAVKVGRSISPWLHLVSVRAVEEEEEQVKWRWHRPLQSAFVAPRNRVIDGMSAQKGFSEGRRPTEAWSKFDAGEIVYCWEVETPEEENSIPNSMFERAV
ncbi:hypothetical protein CYMTET_45718 [Cymbomonas tetramitiformis]|uniref:Uncharacterized protein n=1 Tax=Cymbomonas tetramitiformis TaxID=36881 RepID=A0AAE0BXN4_9CHLO|nr:hypothetical protein CYMTET_45718 [Cymbomonas tetramitiformis]